jgi:ABC-type Fe3+/spermidine/putrescine transport system ATPase subunit
MVTTFGERWQVRAAGAPEAQITVGVRPESLALERGANAGEAWNPLTGTVVEAAYLGAVVRYQVQVADGVSVIAEIHNPDFAAIRAVGDRVTLWFGASRAVLLPNQASEA